VSFVLDGNNPTDLGVKLLKDLQEPGVPEVRKREVAIPGKAGTYSFGDEYGNRIFRLPLVTTDTSSQSDVQDVIRAIADLLTTDQGELREVSLIFDKEPNKAYTVKLDSSYGVNRFPGGFGKFVLGLVATQPFAEGTTETKTKNVTSSPEEIELTNEGSVETPMIITITNEGSSAVSSIKLEQL